MSKISELHNELTEQAAELGYKSIEEAENNGYTIDYDKRKLVDARDIAHDMWLIDKNENLYRLRTIAKELRSISFTRTADELENIADFFENGEI